MVRSNVGVYIRTRPVEQFPSDTLQINKENKTVTVLHGSRALLSSDKATAVQQYQFQFDGVLHNASQEDVYEACAVDVVNGALEGYNGTIMCYGQTGAGKTYTMTGNRQAFKQRGLIPRAIAGLLGSLKTAPNISQWQLHVTYLEIYNESMFDLLDITTQPHELTIYEDARGQLQVQGLRKVAIRSEQEALSLFFEGETNRVIGEHQLNRESSRSHSIFTMQLEVVHEGDSQKTLSKVSLVDLAGSERVSKTRSEGLVLREAGHINKSLHILEQVVHAASEKNRDHIPYRSCKLTHVLKDALGGNCSTVLIANIWGDAAQIDETLSTCRFAARMARLTAEVTSNVLQESSARVKQLEREVAELQEELAMMHVFQHQALASNHEPIQHSAYTEAQRQQLRELVRQFLELPDPYPVSLSPLPLTSARQLREVLYALKAVCKNTLQGDGSSANSKESMAPPAAAGMAGGAHDSTAYVHPGRPAAAAPAAAGVTRGAAGLRDTGDPNGHAYVGEVDGEDQSSGVGIAPDDARPGVNSSASRPSSTGSRQEHNISNTSQKASSSRAVALEYGAAGSDGNVPGSLADSFGSSEAALQAFKAGPGSAKVQLLNNNHVKMKAARKQAKDLALTLNALKGQIDELKGQQEELKAQRLASGDDSAQVLSDSELEVLASLRDMKTTYKEKYAELQAARSEVEYTQALVETCRQELMADFTEWKPQGRDTSEGSRVHSQLSPAASNHSQQQWDPTTEQLPQQEQAQTEAKAWSKSSTPGPDRGSYDAGFIPASVGTAAGPFSRAQPGGRQGAAAAAARSRGSTPPLASLVGSLDEDGGDLEAMAYYQAQANNRLGGAAGLKAGAMKKVRGEKGTFSNTHRTGITQMVVRSRMDLE